MATTAEMTKSLKVFCVPLLRNMGFKGSFPNFYRDSDGFVALVNFQFNRAGTKFCINLAYADPERMNVVSHRRHVEPQKLRVSFTGALGGGTGGVTERWRIGSRPIDAEHYSDSWFAFAPDQSNQEHVETVVAPDHVAKKCTELITQEAEPWWREKRSVVSAQ